MKCAYFVIKLMTRSKKNLKPPTSTAAVRPQPGTLSHIHAAAPPPRGNSKFYSAMEMSNQTRKCPYCRARDESQMFLHINVLCKHKQFYHGPRSHDDSSQV